MCLRKVQLVMTLTGAVSLESMREVQCSDRLLGPLEQHVSVSSLPLRDVARKTQRRKQQLVV